MTLYEIDQAILECFDEETGEIFDSEKMNMLELERDEKCESIACWIKELKLEAEAIKSEKERLDERQKKALRKAEALSKYLKEALCGSKFKTARCEVSYRKSTVVEITPNADIPAEYLRVKVVEEPNKELIKKDLKEGKQIIGCELVEKQSIVIK